MKPIVIIILSAIIITTCSAVHQQNGKGVLSSDSPQKFSQKLADSLGADQYGMKAYTMVLLTTGSAQIQDKEKKAELMRGHMENIGKLAKEGKIIVAGPFLEPNKEKYRGLFIFNTKLKEEAENWVKTDPAVSAGIFNYEIFSWYGSAALPVYLKYHDKVARENP